MKSRKKGEIQTLRTNPGVDKHKLWLIIGIVLVAVLVLAILLLSPAKEAFFGKAISGGRASGVRAGSGIATSGTSGSGTSVGTSTSTLPTGITTPPTSGSVCMNIQLLPVRTTTINRVATSTPQDRTQTTNYRKRVCESSSGCVFSDCSSGSPGCTSSAIVGGYLVEDPANLANDACIGSTTACPNIALYPWVGVRYENARRNLCEAQGCVFTSGGSPTPTPTPIPTPIPIPTGGAVVINVNAATGDSCVPPPAAAVEICTNKADDDGDGNADCRDTDCQGLIMDLSSSIARCEQPEVSCFDGFDNDGDTNTDGNDNGCEGQLCVAGESKVWVRSVYPGSTTSVAACCADSTSCAALDGACVALNALSSNQANLCIAGGGWMACTSGLNGQERGLEGARYLCTVAARETTGRWTAVTENIPPSTGTESDFDGDGLVSSSDVTFLLYVLRAQGDASCGDATQTICDYSDDGIFACDSGIVQAMADESDRSHATDICTATLSGDINGDGVVDSSDVTFLLYILRAQGDASCGGATQTICNYSEDGVRVCDSGFIYGMASEDDVAHVADICS